MSQARADLGNIRTLAKPSRIRTTPIMPRPFREEIEISNAFSKIGRSLKFGYKDFYQVVNGAFFQVIIARSIYIQIKEKSK